jgi:hypothetical protein
MQTHTHKNRTGLVAVCWKDKKQVYAPAYMKLPLRELLDKSDSDCLEFPCSLLTSQHTHAICRMVISYGKFAELEMDKRDVSSFSRPRVILPFLIQRDTWGK